MSIALIEDFTGAAATMGGVWTQQQPALSTVNLDGANHGRASSNANDGFVYRDDRVFSPNQYSQVRIFSGLSSTVRYITVMARASGVDGTAQDYEFYTDGGTGLGHSEIAKRLANTPVVLGTIAATFTSLDVIKIVTLDIGKDKVLITILKNGVSVGSVIDSTSPILTGAPGCGALGITMLIDDWEGWDLPIISTGKPYKGNDDIGLMLENDYKGMFILTE